MPDEGEVCERHRFQAAHWLCRQELQWRCPAGVGLFWERLQTSGETGSETTRRKTGAFRNRRVTEEQEVGRVTEAWRRRPLFLAAEAEDRAWTSRLS